MNPAAEKLYFITHLRVLFAVCCCTFLKSIFSQTLNEIVSTFLSIESKTSILYVNMDFTGNLFLRFGRFRWPKIYLRLYVLQLVTDRGNYRRWSIKRDVLKSFAKFTENHLCWSLLFDKNWRQPLKKRLKHRCFLVNFAKF